MSQQSLRRLVSRLQGCLSALSARESRVLVLRSGFGVKRGYSRWQVAQIMRVSLAQERRLEARAVSHLEQASAQGQCGNPVSSIRSAVLRFVSALMLVSQPAQNFAARASATGRSGHPSPSGQADRPGGGHSGASGQSPTPAYNRAAITSPDHGGLDWELVLFALLGGLTALLLISTRMRAHRRSAFAAPAPASAASSARRLPGRFGALARMVRRRQLGHGTEALAGAVGLIALRRAASARRGGGRHLAGTSTAPAGPTARSSEAPALAAPAASEVVALAPDHTSRSGPELVNAAADFELGAMLAQRGDMAGAQAAFRRADEQGHPVAASNLGVLLEERGHLAEAEAAYRRADQRGAAAGALNLGAMLADRGDVAAAESALRRADERGDAGGAARLGVLLERRGDLSGAEAAYRRADQRGDADSAFKLAEFLARRADLAGAEAAYRRADERGHAAAASNLGVLLEQRGDTAGAEAAFRRADGRGDAGAALSLGMLLEQRGDTAGAEAAFHRADERGDADGSYRLGAILEESNDLVGAEAAYQRAAQRGRGGVAEAARAALSQLSGRRR